MPSPGQSPFGVGFFLNVAVTSVLTYIIFWDIYTIPDSLSVFVKIYFTQASYSIFSTLLQSSLGTLLGKVFRWCFTAAIFLVLAPFVLLWQFGKIAIATGQRALNQQAFMKELESTPTDGRLARFPDATIFPPPVTVKSTYQYQQLWEDDEIRLLEIVPAKEDAAGHVQLQGRIIHTSLSTAPPFTALSYCWNDLGYAGSATSSPDAILDLGSDGILVLTPNLYSGLQSARKRGYFQSSLFWVDQICINQDDLIEKASQVAMMKDIYEQAFLVLVWLGDDAVNGEVNRALQFAERIAECIDKNNLLSPEFDFFPNIFTSSNDFGVPPIHTSVFEYLGLIKLLTRPWFQRSWIVQEVSLNYNKRAMCGSTEISFDTLAKALLFCTKSVDILTSFVPVETKAAFHAMIQSAVLTQRSIAPPSSALLDVLVRHRGCKASLASDKVFAFLNISDDVDALGIKADYTLCSRFVYTNTAVAILQQSDNLDILSAANAWPASHTNGRVTAIELSNKVAANGLISAAETCSHAGHPAPLPSWVPDWSIPVLAPSFQSKDEYGNYFSNYRATGNSIKTVQFRHNNHVLGLDGDIMDRIIGVGPAFPEETGLQIGQHYNMVKIWADMCGAWESGKTYQLTKESMLDAFAHTLTCGDKETVLHSATNPSATGGGIQPVGESRKSWLGGDAPFTGQFTQLFLVFRINWIIDRIWPNAMNRPAVYGILQMIVTFTLEIWAWTLRLLGLKAPAVSVSSGYRQRFFASVTYRRFIVTENGLIGLASPQVQPNDYVALFAGGKVPITLRDAKGKDGPGSLWEIVGDAYVHGMMFGELFWPEDQRKTLWIS